MVFCFRFRTISVARDTTRRYILHLSLGSMHHGLLSNTVKFCQICITCTQSIGDSSVQLLNFDSDMKNKIHHNSSERPSRNVVKYGTKYSLRNFQILYVNAESAANFRTQYKFIQNFQISRGYVVRILHYFGTKFSSFYNFEMLFPLMVMEFLLHV